MFASVEKVYQLTMYLEAEKGGTSERLHLPFSTIDTVLTTAKLLCDYRMACLPATWEMSWAKVSSIGKPKDRRAVPYAFPVDGLYTGVLSGTPPAASPSNIRNNIDNDAIMYGVETLEGAYANRFLHGVPDAEVSFNQLASALLTNTGTQPLPAAIAADATWEQRVGYYFRAIKENTVFFRQRVQGATIERQTDLIVALILRKVTSKKLGRPFSQQRGKATPR